LLELYSRTKSTFWKIAIFITSQSSLSRKEEADLDMASTETPKNESSTKQDTTVIMTETTPPNKLHKTTSIKNDTPNIRMDDIQLAHLSSTVSGAAAATTTPETAYQPALSDDADPENDTTPKPSLRIAATLLALGVRPPYLIFFK
jgi:hypothetical protein